MISSHHSSSLSLSLSLSSSLSLSPHQFSYSLVQTHFHLSTALNWRYLDGENDRVFMQLPDSQLQEIRTSEGHTQQSNATNYNAWTEWTTQLHKVLNAMIIKGCVPPSWVCVVCVADYLVSSNIYIIFTHQYAMPMVAIPMVAITQYEQARCNNLLRWYNQRFARTHSTLSDYHVSIHTTNAMLQCTDPLGGQMDLQKSSFKKAIYGTISNGCREPQAHLG